MKYAIVNGKKTEPSKGAKGTCPGCGSELIAKCGEVKIHHWAHKGNRNCDHWWENETEWHRAWKNQFPIEWQKVVQFDVTGEKHIADIKTDSALVIEFQHSYLKPEERQSREAFYKKLIWVVDGTRCLKDKSRFFKVVEEGTRLKLDPFNIMRVEFPEESRILKEWISYTSPVFFDFGEANGLWFVLPISSIDMAYILPFGRSYFLESCVDCSLEDDINNVTLLINEYLDQIKKQHERALKRQVSNFLRRSIRKKSRRRF